MTAVFKHELSTIFTGMTGYVFSAFLLLFAGIYTMAYNLNSGLPNFEYVLSSMSFIFLIVVPILTMRSLAEEKRQRTDQLLYSLPLTMTKVVLGKYLAMLVMFLVPVAVMGLYPLALSAYGELWLPGAYGALLAFFFLGAALIALGIFISALSESQAVSAGLCFAALLVNYYLSSLASFIPTTATASFIGLSLAVLLLSAVFQLMTHSTLLSAALFLLLETGLFALSLFKEDALAGLLPDILSSLSLFGRFESFITGVFDLTALVFYVSVAAVFLFLSIQAMEKRRWS